MNPLLKKISAFFLLAVLLAPLSYSPVFKARQARVQRYMKKQLQGNMMHHLVMAREDLRWVKPGKEIMVGEKMFDIKTIEYRADGMVFITGLYDHEESFLYAQLKKNRKEENNRNNQQLVQLFQLMQALPDRFTEQDHFSHSVAQQWPRHTGQLLPSPFQSLLTPPPRA